MNIMLSYSEFKKGKEEKILNEGILGDALKSLKDKFALSVSKRIGGAKKIDKTIELRKVELKDILNQKLKLEEELLLAKRAFEDSDGDDNLRTQYEQKKKAVAGQMGAISKKERASKKKFDVNLGQLKAKGSDAVKGYSDLQEANMEMELADIEMQAYKKMGRDTSKLEAKIKKALQKKKEEAKDVIKISKDLVYDYVNSKGVQLSVKVLSDEPDNDGYWTVVNVKKEGESEGFRVKAEDLKANKNTEQPEGENSQAAQTAQNSTTA